MSSYQLEEIQDQKFKVDVIRKHIRKNSNTILDKIEIAVNWYQLIKPLEDRFNQTIILGNNSYKLLLAVKSLIIQQIYGLNEFPFETEVADRKSFQKFLNLQFGDSVPDNASLASFKEKLESEGLYERVFDGFFKQLLDSDIIPEQDLLLPSQQKKQDKMQETAEPVHEVKEELVSEKQDDGNLSVDDMIKEIEDRVKNLYEKKSPAEKKILEKSGLRPGVTDEAKTIDQVTKQNGNGNGENPVYKKLAQIDDTLKQLYKNIDGPKEETPAAGIETDVKKEIQQTLEEKTKGIFNKLDEIDVKLKNLNKANDDVIELPAGEITVDPVAPKITPTAEPSGELLNKLLEIDKKLKDIQTVKEEEKDLSKQEDLYKKLFDSFYSKFMEANPIGEKTATEEPVITDEPVKKEESLVVETPTIEEVVITEAVKEEKPEEEVKSSETVTEPVTEEKTETKTEEESTFHDYVLEGKFEKETGKTIPVVMVPKKGEINLKDKKKYPIFNNANLTEDYELGLRFYKLGFKTSFVNLRTDRLHGNSRIATGEYFPNSFWACVRQKSRWIAGIAFQNWKIHKWQGSLKTKYFLLRDRKAIFSAIGTILSYLVLLYFAAYLITSAFGLKVLEPLVAKNSVLWYFIILSLFFMIWRLFHRFAFTYNWYGLRYALMSIVRLLFDNVVNFFATIRAFKVFRQTKDTVVWDSTEHY